MTLLLEFDELVIVEQCLSDQQPRGFPAKAFVRRYLPSELIGGIQEGDRQVTVCAEDLDKWGFDGIARTVVVRGRSLAVVSTDDDTYRENGLLSALVFRVRG